MEEGYSLRHVLVDALLSCKIVETSELNSVVEQLKELVLSLDKRPTNNSTEVSLSESFLSSIRQSVKDGLYGQ